MATPSANAKNQGFERHRKQVLGQPLAQGIEPGEVAEFLSTLSLRKFPAVAYSQRGDDPFVQPRGGFPLFDQQRQLSVLLSEAGADFIPLTIDSYTRQNEHDTATQLLQRSEDEERNYLNGYPLISHGYQLTRDLYRDIDKPVSLRHGTPDARLLVEVALASGITEIEGGGVCYSLPYSEGFPLDRALLYWQYVDRICALYSTEERPIQRESFGPLTATMVPPAIAIAVQIVEALLAAEQGVKSVTVSFGQTGSIIQDLATAQVLRKLVRHYLDIFDFDAVKCFVAYHQWMGQFPSDQAKAGALIACSTQIASMIRADKVIVKTTDEAFGVPTPEVNAEAVRAARYVLRTFRCLEPVTSPAAEMEARLIESEARSILETILDMSGGLFWESVYRALQNGIIDVPFSPHSDNANQLISMRDINGSIRIKHFGNVPVSKEDADMELELLAARGDESSKEYKQLLSDINIMV